MGLGYVLVGAFLAAFSIFDIVNAADAASGHALARKWCSSCHAIDSQSTGTDAAPTFQSLAQRRDNNWIRSWLSTPHPPMTGIDLSRDEIKSITKYLESLRVSAQRTD